MSAGSWITWPKSSSRAPLRLFCFPHAGGGVALFHHWLARLHPQIDVYRVHLPGREHRIAERPFERFPEMVETLAAAIRGHLDVPFAFFGHSMGALIGFELARELRRRRQAGPAHLFVSGHRAPQLRDPDPPIHRLPEPAFVAALRRLEGTSEEVLCNAELMQLMMPALRCDFAACETYAYVPEAPLACPISAFGGADDPKVGPAAIAAWRHQTTGAFVQRIVPGTHFFLYGARDLLLNAIAEDLGKSTTRRAGGLA